VHLFRNVYESAFTLIGVVCEEDKRRGRIVKKYRNAGDKDAEEFMRRDAKDARKHGQQVSDTFYLSDFFIENSTERLKDGKIANPDWRIAEELGRLIKIITHQELVRPRIDETGMYEAHGVAMRSACLSRQVGAALVNRNGDVVAIGTNEVPKAGGGVYGESFELELSEGRCAYWSGVEKYCSNTREQNEIIENLIQAVLDSKLVQTEKVEDLRSRLQDTRIGGLLEFSRAVHAEMDALLSAARKGISPSGARMFVTTFPCHYCARHIVTAGIDEVQFIEPYPKSQALKLHWDSISIDPNGWEPPSNGGSKVLFRPFTGVAPQLYRRAFTKDRELKDERTGIMKIGSPKWGSPWHGRRISYIQLEAELANNIPSTT
jgi:deoxycytidylate deaminase